MAMNDVDEFFRRINGIWKRVLAGGDKTAEAEFWMTVSYGEQHMPELRDNGLIAECVITQLVKQAEAAGYPQYEEGQYRVRVQKIAKSLQHPFMLLVVPDLLAKTKEDPMELLDACIAKIDANSLRGTPFMTRPTGPKSS